MEASMISKKSSKSRPPSASKRAEQARTPTPVRQALPSSKPITKLATRRGGATGTPPFFRAFCAISDPSSGRLATQRNSMLEGCQITTRDATASSSPTTRATSTSVQGVATMSPTPVSNGNSIAGSVVASGAAAFPRAPRARAPLRWSASAPTSAPVVLLLDHEGEVDVEHRELADVHRLVANLRHASAVHNASDEAVHMTAGMHLLVVREALLESEFRHAQRIASPVDPAESNAAAHPESAIALRLVGDLHAAGGADESGEARLLARDAHLGVARDALLAARLLALDCVDIAGSLGDVFCASKMFGEAEAEFRRAQRIACPVDPAENNAAYGMYDEEAETTAAERVEEARDRTRRAYARMTVEDLVPLAVDRVLYAARLSGAVVGHEHGKCVAEAFPNLARAYMDQELVRGLAIAATLGDLFGLDASIDRRAFLRRTLTLAEHAAQAFPRSAVIASFHATLLFVLGEYDSAESECRRALGMKEPDDPQHDCIPPGSISGENHGARLVSLACEFHELLNRILVLAKECWDSMPSEKQEGFLSVKLDVLQEEYRKVDRSKAFTISDALNFMKEKGSWGFWVCPICDGKKFLDSVMLLSHMSSKHPRAVLPRLRSVLDPKLSEKALESDDFLDGVSLCQDSNQQDVISFDKRSDLFKWLFCAPSSGVVAKPFQEIRETKRQQGTMLLESIKEKMKTLPADKSTSEFAEALPEINELWHNFLRASHLDYRAMIATLARSFLWKKLKKCMTEDLKATVKFISAADIDEVFTMGDNKDVESPVESEVQAAESSETMVNDTEFSDSQIKETEGENVLETEMKNLKIDPNADGSMATSEAGSSDPNAQQQV